MQLSKGDSALYYLLIILYAEMPLSYFYLGNC